MDSISTSTSTSMDSDTYSLPHSLWLTIMMGIVAVLLNVAAILGNLVVLFAFGLERKLWQPYNFCIASLAVACLLMSLFSMPLGISYFLLDRWVFGRGLCEIWLAIDWAAGDTVGYTILVIVMDRYLRLKLRSNYLHWRAEGKVLPVITGIWAVPVLFSAIMGIIWETYMKQHEPPDDECDLQFQDSTLFACVHIFFIFWGPAIAACIFYALICKEVLAIKRTTQGQPRTSGNSGHSSGSAPGPTMPRSDKNTLGGTKNNNNAADRRLAQKDTRDRVMKSQFPKLHYSNSGKLGDQRKTNVNSEHDSIPDFNFNSKINSSVCVVHFLNSAKRFLDNSNQSTHLHDSSSSVNEGLPETKIFARSVYCNFFFKSSKSEDRGCLQHCLRRFRFGCFMETRNVFCMPHCTHTNAYDFFVDLPGIQTTPLPPPGNRVSCRFTNQKSLLETLVSENMEWIPSVNESQMVDSDMIYIDTSSIHGRRPAFPLLASGVLELENPICHCKLTSEVTATTTELTTTASLYPGYIRPPSTVYKYLPQKQHLRLDTLTILAIGAKTDRSEKHAQTSGSAMNPHNAHLHKKSQSKTSPGSNKTDNKLVSSTLPLVEEAKQPSTNKQIRVKNKRRPFRKKTIRTAPLLSRKLQKEAFKSLQHATIILGAFMLFWAPWGAMIVIRAFCDDCVNIQVYNLADWFTYLHCCAVPVCVVYSCMDITKTIRRILRFDWHRE